MKVPVCPVCGLVLKTTVINPVLYYCEKRKFWLTEPGMYIDIIDATIYMSADGRKTLKIIDIPPFTFTIFDEINFKRTKIYKIMPSHQTKSLTKEMVLDIAGTAIDLPWNDKEKVLDKIKLYLLFS